MESGDQVTLVDRFGNESPVMVRILRAVTPRTFSARLLKSRWKNPNENSPHISAEGSNTSSSSVRHPRIFEIVHDDYQQVSTKVSI
jgi:hypothetical protein